MENYIPIYFVVAVGSEVEYHREHTKDESSAVTKSLNTFTHTKLHRKLPDNKKAVFFGDIVQAI